MTYSASDYLLDRANIQDTIVRMAWSADRKDWDTTAAQFADELVMDYTSMFGGEPVTTTPRNQAEVWKGMLEYMDGLTHATTNLLVDLPQPSTSAEHPTEASATCNILVTLRRDAAHGDPIQQSGGIWSFKLSKSASANGGNPWRIEYMKADAAWMKGNADVTKNPKTGKGWL
ncbi:hypothetical protein FB45DRAFT_1057151 [Roridomyces roridus]|uniref:SnoaL-like domain-containing protein n=1 Tax=Roridomyces roridus TaxID=1738132 RepID=A0AAD7C205_9AGAR|nr:hypothetical protein FB45DRAFT_1057151 [Roridomyces roridus]